MSGRAGGADLYLLKFIMHDWDDERAAPILANVRRAIAHLGVVCRRRDRPPARKRAACRAAN
ncbi:methyltransferase [Mesorhizobium sp. Root695]|uniref:methyltransferase n=1 Tax=Mesorhizobium sp. Root695 TaxID=1736589 RepID=UPI0039B75112